LKSRQSLAALFYAAIKSPSAELGLQQGGIAVDVSCLIWLNCL
jgi:hypothetical protein